MKRFQEVTKERCRCWRRTKNVFCTLFSSLRISSFFCLFYFRGNYYFFIPSDSIYHTHTNIVCSCDILRPKKKQKKLIQKITNNFGKHYDTFTPNLTACLHMPMYCKTSANILAKIAKLCKKKCRIRIRFCWLKWFHWLQFLIGHFHVTDCGMIDRTDRNEKKKQMMFEFDFRFNSSSRRHTELEQVHWARKSESNKNTEQMSTKQSEISSAVWSANLYE